MQVCDRRELAVSLVGAIVVVITAGTVAQSLDRPALWIPGIAAGVFFYYFNMRRFFGRRSAIKRGFPADWRAFLEERVAYYRRLNAEEKSRFEQDVLLFLSESRITGVGVQPEDEDRLLIAASAVMLIFGHPDWEYKNLPEILIYPDSFDEDYSFTTDRRRRTVSGLHAPNNALIFSRKDLLRSFEEKEEVYHVGLHEFAHALDAADGATEGIPSELNPQWIKEWYDLMRKELGNVRRQESVLNPYAGTNTAELFAVAVEHFFTRPQELEEKHPRLYRALSSFFNQKPGERK